MASACGTDVPCNRGREAAMKIRPCALGIGYWQQLCVAVCLAIQLVHRTVHPSQVGWATPLADYTPEFYFMRGLHDSLHDFIKGTASLNCDLV